ncbi:MAG: hypothetical protein ACREX7_06845 [Casimicrobiaceae bacterium]
MNRYCAIAFLFCGAVAYAGPEAGGVSQVAPEPTIDARWAEHHVNFNYFGHTAGLDIYYNCDVLEAKLERLLRMAGAREDMKVRAHGCEFGSQRLSALIMADLYFKSPTLAPPQNPAKAGEVPPAAARWNPVSLRLGGMQGFDPSDCLLVDAFRRQVLQYFDLRNITADLPCSIGFAAPRSRKSLEFEALTATPTAEKESIQFEKQPRKHDDKLKSERS